MWKWIVLIIVVALVAALTIAYGLYRQAAAEAEAAMADIKSRAKPAIQTFDAAMLSGLPEIAQRYFRHAIMPGSRLGLTVRLEMQGTFLLGDKGQSQSFEMQAQQILAPPSEFVWIPEMMSGLITYGLRCPRFWSGLDALLDQWIVSGSQPANITGSHSFGAYALSHGSNLGASELAAGKWCYVGADRSGYRSALLQHWHRTSGHNAGR